jgi:colicin import membrane protein
MKSELNPANSDRPFPFYLRRSSYIHAALLILTLIGGKAAIEAQKKIREKNIELIQASVRVDMVAMPTHTVNELKNLSSGVEEPKPQTPEPAPIEEKKVEEKVEEKPVAKEEEKVEVKQDSAQPVLEEKKSKKRSNFLSKLKEIGHKEIKTPGTQKAEKGLGGQKRNELKQLVLAGNKLSKGVQIFGEGAGRDMNAFHAYASKLPDLVRRHWKLPSFLMDRKFKCRIRIWLSPAGEVTRTEVYQSSGDKEYDQRAVEAIKSAAPFPKMGAEIGSRGIQGDILLGFPL